MFHPEAKSPIKNLTVRIKFHRIMFHVEHIEV